MGDQPQESRRGTRPDLGEGSRVLRHSLPARLRTPHARESRTTGRPRRLGTRVAALARRGPHRRSDVAGRPGANDPLSWHLWARSFRCRPSTGAVPPLRLTRLLHAARHATPLLSGLWSARAPRVLVAGGEDTV